MSDNTTSGLVESVHSKVANHNIRGERCVLVLATSCY
jgi:hypothetical protein